MEKLTPEQEIVLEALDEQIQKLEKKLEKYRPFFDRLSRLHATRRTLLSEKRTTSGGGNSRAKITMEEVITVFRKNDGEAMQPAEIGEALGIDATIVRSHLNRHKDTRYEKTNDGWQLIGEEE